MAVGGRERGLAMEERRARDREAVEAVVEGHGFHLVYQPIVHLDTGDVAGVEALCRFDDGAPTEHRFRTCEELGLAGPLDLAIVEQALADFPRLPGGYLALNLSASTICDRALQALLEAADVPHRRLVIEITEHARIPDYEQAAAVIDALRAKGVRLAVDDAGAGWASFRHILSLRPDIIKMDRSLTRGVDVDPARRALAMALAIFAGEVGATVVAEGVETDGEVRALRLAGIHRGQGFVLALPQPLPVDHPGYIPLDLDALLEGSRAPGTPELDDPGAGIGVTAHSLLSAVGAIESALALLRQRSDRIDLTDSGALLVAAERQAHHVGHVLHNLVRGLPAGATDRIEAVDPDRLQPL
ncbi:MAG: EAL domain-containing protein [Acidimicrobiia bacterium]|nr:EAL domain-containing protein [Acidimicrobiia bacterium]